NAESLTGHATDIRFPTRRAIKGNITDDNILFGHERRKLRRKDDNFASRQTLPDVVIGVAFQEEGHPLWHESAKALAGTSSKMNLDRIFGQGIRTPAPSDFTPDNRTNDAVDIADGENRNHFLFAFERRSAQPQQHRIVESFIQTVVLRNLAEPTDVGRDFG